LRCFALKATVHSPNFDGVLVLPWFHLLARFHVPFLFLQLYFPREKKKDIFPRLTGYFLEGEKKPISIFTFYGCSATASTLNVAEDCWQNAVFSLPVGNSAPRRF